MILVKLFKDAAKNPKLAGFDGVECKLSFLSSSSRSEGLILMHVANGFLVHQGFYLEHPDRQVR
jgi:hypothetical protein